MIQHEDTSVGETDIIFCDRLLLPIVMHLSFLVEKGSIPTDPSLNLRVVGALGAISFRSSLTCLTSKLP